MLFLKWRGIESVTFHTPLYAAGLNIEPMPRVPTELNLHSLQWICKPSISNKKGMGLSVSRVRIVVFHPGFLHFSLINRAFLLLAEIDGGGGGCVELHVT